VGKWNLWLPRISAAVMGAAIALTSAPARAAAPATQPSQESPADVHKEMQDLRAQMEKMKLREQTLEKKLQEQETAAASAQSMAVVTAGVIHDADQHSQLFTESAVGSGYDPTRGFIIASEDGNFLLHPFLLLQVRNVTNWRDGAKANGSDDTQNGFEIRRMQIGFDGNVFTPDLTYRLFIQTERSGGDAALFDAWVKYHFPDTPWYVEAGQFKTPFAHEQMVYDRTLLAADRTLTDDILASGEAFSQGVMAIFDNHDAIRAKADFTNGFGVNDVNFEDYPVRPANFGIGLRGEYKFTGQWRDYDQFTSEGDKEDLAVLGGGLDWTEADPFDAVRQAIDFQWNHGGLGVYAGYIGRYTANNGAPGDTFDVGAVGQISYLFTDQHWEIFGRYDYLKLDGREFAAGTNTNIHEITVGVNYYLFGQNFKLTLDGSYLPNGSPVDDNGSGVLVNDGRGEAIVRAQAQLGI
jgi:phosphate-selective porin OprO and OprP